MRTRPGLILRRPGWWGGRAHRLYTLFVFVVLAALDNTAIALLPPLFGVVSADLGVSVGALGAVTGSVILVTAVTAVLWGYIGDRSNRKLLLIAGTLLWVTGTAATPLASGFAGLLGFQALSAVGLGVIASVSFAVVSDLISPRRRGLAMSFWGLSQGVGTLAGTIGAGVLGAADWRRPFLFLAAAGVITTVAYVFAYNTPRGASEPALQDVIDENGVYEERIEPSDIPGLIARRTNIWLVLQGFTAQIAYGSLIWLPRLFQANVEAQGYDLATATVVGSVFASLFQLGAVMSIFGGWIGDRWQRRNRRGRALVSTIGILGAIPLFMVLFFLPLPVDIPPGAGTRAIIITTLTSVVTSPAVALAFVVALAALTFTSADSPNWFALIGDVNLPEHRGTVFGVANLSNGVGRALGTALTGSASGFLFARLPPPLNFAVGLALFQVFFLPTGWCYWQASKTAPDDIDTVETELKQRADRARGYAVRSAQKPPTTH